MYDKGIARGRQTTDTLSLLPLPPFQAFGDCACDMMRVVAQGSLNDFGLGAQWSMWNSGEKTRITKFGMSGMTNKARRMDLVL